jgi:capsular polysaccharide biosynthesis protein
LNIQLMAEKQRLADLNNQIGVYEGRVKQMPVEEVAYDKIERDYMLANNIRNNTQAELKAAQIDEERDRITSSQSVDLIVKPDATAVDSKSKKVLLYLLGPIIGLLVGFCFSLALEAMDHSLRTPLEVESYLGKPVLAVIPKIQESKESIKRIGGAPNQQLPS